MTAAGLHPRTWLLWLLLGFALLLDTQNPIYLALLLVVVGLVARRWGRPDLGWRLPWRRLAPLLLLLPAIFNMATVHSGATVLWRLPASWPGLGGAWTLEAALYGLITGLVLLGLLALFSTFNQIVAVADMVRLLPPALQDVGVVILIALTYLPQTAAHVERVRAAQALRGHRLRGWRDWSPLVIPILVGGLERALTLAEAMVARGYGQAAAAAAPTWLRLLLAAALLLALAGWFAAVWWGWPGAVLLLLAGAGLLLALRRINRDRPRTTYQARPVRRQDQLLPLLLAAAAGLYWQPWWPVGAGYTPFPEWGWPAVSLPGVLALLVLGAPVFIGPTRSTLRVE